MTTIARSGPKLDPNQVLWKVIDRLDEQRLHPRLPLRTTVSFRNCHGQHCAGDLQNISPDGLQVRCNVASAQIVHPAGGRLLPDNLPILQASLSLPLASGEETLALGVRLLYLAAVAEEPRCVLGFQFLDLRPKAQRVIGTFFTEQLRALEYMTNVA